VLEYYINELLSEGIYHVPTWAELTAAAGESSGHGHTSSVEAAETSASSSALGAAAAAGPSSGHQSLWRGAAISASTMHLGASAGNIAIDTEGTRYDMIR